MLRQAKSSWSKNKQTPGLALFFLVLSIAGFLCAPSFATAASELDQIEKRIDSGSIAKDDTDKLTALSQALNGNPRPHILLGRLYSSYNFGELASQEFEEALKLDSNQPQVWVLLINEKYRHTKLAEAEAISKRAEKVLPNDPELLLIKGLLYCRTNRAADAEKLLEKAHALKPGDPIIYTALSEAQYLQQRYPDSLNSAESALKLNSNYPDAYMRKAEALLKLNRGKEALATLSSGYKCGPFHSGIVALYLLESERQGDYLIALEAALAKMGLDANLDNLLGDDKDKVIDMIDLCQSKGVRDTEILAKIRTVSEKLRGTSHLGKFLFCLGDIYDGFGKRDLAINFYQEGLKVEPTFGRAWLRLGQDLERLHQNDEALRCYLNAYKYRKDDQEIVRSLAMMTARRNDWAWQLKEFLWKLLAPAASTQPPG